LKQPEGLIREEDEEEKRGERERERNRNRIVRNAYRVLVGQTLIKLPPKLFLPLSCAGESSDSLITEMYLFSDLQKYSFWKLNLTYPMTVLKCSIFINHSIINTI
jgi:hypothetical protein